jgi:D-glycero-D-manno-heptose 1,7-bisphosphate phosphatase
MLGKAIFLDRDGTINIDKGFVHKPEDFEFLPRAVSALRLLRESFPGWKIIIVTSQSGIARGYYTEEDYKNLRSHVNRELEKQGIALDAEYFCPHHEQGKPPYNTPCDCRKPKPGMLIKAAREHSIDLAKSYMIGDKWADVRAGSSVGCHSILVKTGKAGDDKENKVDNAHVALDLFDAANYIIEREKK